MSERENIPPGAADWKAPGSEAEAQKESFEQKFDREREERLLEADIPEDGRIDVSGRIHFKPVGERLWKDEKLFSDDFLQQHRGEYGVNNSVLCFIDKSGHPWITFDTNFGRRALERAGYKSSGGDIIVPFSNGEEFNKHDGSADRWQGIERRMHDDNAEEERLKDTPGAKTRRERLADDRWDEIQKKKEQGK